MKSNCIIKYAPIGLESGIYFACHPFIIMKVAQQLNNSSRKILILQKKTVLEVGQKLIGEFSVKEYEGTGSFAVAGEENNGKPNEKTLREAKRFIPKSLHLCTNDYYRQIKTRLPVKEETCNDYKVTVSSVENERKGIGLQSIRINVTVVANVHLFAFILSYSWKMGKHFH